MGKTKIQIGIYGMGLLMMGVIGVTGSLSVIGAAFPQASQTMIQNIISIPCLVVIPVTIIVGKLMSVMKKKTLALIGILAFLIGGVAPAFADSILLILVFRGILGVGIGIVQPVASALVAEHYEGAERDRIQGNVTSAQMLGCAVMVFAGGWLSNMSWEKSFYVHLLAVLSFVLVLVFIPGGEDKVKESESLKSGESGKKTGITKGAWLWAGTMFLLFIAAQIYSIYLSFLVIDERSLGSPTEAGSGLAFFAIGGFVMGIVYGKLSGILKKRTLAAGMLGILLSYLIIATAGSMILIYLGCLLFGLSLSACMPFIIVSTANSVDSLAAGMAISITMCGQNFAQFLCPYVINPIAGSINKTAINQTAFFIGAAMLAVMVVVSLIVSGKKTN